MRPADETVARMAAADAEIGAELTDERLDRMPVWDLEDRAETARELIVSLSASDGFDSPQVVRLVALKRRLIGSIERQLGRMFPPTA